MLKPLSFHVSKAKNGGRKKKKKDLNAKLAAVYDSHQDGERKTLIETHPWFISIVCLWESSCQSSRWRDIAECRENEDNCGKNRKKNNEGHAVKTNYIDWYHLAKECYLISQKGMTADILWTVCILQALINVAQMFDSSIPYFSNQNKLAISRLKNSF